MPADAHVLDRPIWNSLTTRQADFAVGSARAVRYAPDVGIFAASASRSADDLAALAKLAVPGTPLAMQEEDGWPLPPGFTGMRRSVDQMVAAAPRLLPSALPYLHLTDADAPDMLALASVTQPGPFLARTHCLGNFYGIRINGQLVAMAGERMKVAGYTEVSGVCTHPDHRGKGYAADLMRIVMAGIVSRGETPFLHVLTENVSAIELYKKLGYRLRRQLPLTVLTP